jgi:hypothetical protein
MNTLKLIIYLFLFSPLLFNCDVEAQTKRHKRSHVSKSHSKSCGSCGVAVSVNSTVGMTCPHCGVTWGTENTTQRTSYDNSDIFDNSNQNYKYTSPYGISNAKCFCGRTKKSTEILCYKCRTTCVCGNTKDVNQVLCMKCRTTCVCGRQKSVSDILCYKCKTTCFCGKYKDKSQIMCRSCRLNY